MLRMYSSGTRSILMTWLPSMYFTVCTSTSNMYVCMYGHTHSKVWINRVRLPILLVVSWTGKMNISLAAFAPENLVLRDGFGSPVPRQPAHFRTQAESGACLRDSSRVPRRRPFIYLQLHKVFAYYINRRGLKNKRLNLQKEPSPTSNPNFKTYIYINSNRALQGIDHRQ